jgi:hypothetical protein
LKNKDTNKDKKDEEIQSLKSNLDNLKQVLKSYEEINLKSSDLEKKLRNANAKHEKEIKSLEDNYSEKIRILMKKITQYEETLKINNFAYKSNLDDESNNLNFLVIFFIEIIKFFCLFFYFYLLNSLNIQMILKKMENLQFHQ